MMLLALMSTKQIRHSFPPQQGSWLFWLFNFFNMRFLGYFEVIHSFQMHFLT